MEPLLLIGLLTVVSKNIVETIKHFADFGDDTTYTPIKGMWSVLAPLVLAVGAWFAENQGAALDLLGSLGVDVTSPTFAAVLTGLLAGFVAPEAYDVQKFVKAKVHTNNNMADATVQQARMMDAQLAAMERDAAGHH